MKYILSLLFSVVSLNGFSQISLGIEAGVNYSDYSVMVSGIDKTTNPKTGMRIGALSNITINKNFYFQPGLYYVANGYRHNLSKGYEQYDFNTIEVPLNIEYTLGLQGSNNIFVGFGPYLAFNRDGHYTINNKPIYSKRALRMGKGATDDIRHFDYGAGINAGYQITNSIFARVRLQLGFADLIPGSSTNNTAKSFGASISAGYLFYRCVKCGKTPNAENTSKQ